MKSFPMFIRTSDRRVVIVSGGEKTAQKARLMPGTVADPLVGAIGSGGTSPGLIRAIKTRLEQMLPRNIGGLAALAGRLRAAVNRRVPRAERRAFRARVFKGAPCEAWSGGQQRDATRAITSAIDAGAKPESASAGHISLVGAGPGARDLLTLRAVERLQQADVIFYDRLVETDVLDLARRDAERVFVGKHVGAHSWPQDRINRVIVAEARRGKRVVRLKSGDPGVFGRATEEIEAARDAGIPVEIVPGVTAAMAAGAALGQSLTQRDVADVLILATGTGCASNPLPDATRFCAPGTTTAIYMGVRQAARLSRELMQKGLPASAPVDIAADVSKPGQTHLRATLGTLEMTLRDARIEGGAILLVTWPKQRAAQRPGPHPGIAAQSIVQMPALAL